MDIQADKANNHQSDIDSDPNAFQRIGTELKSTIFAMVSLLIKEQEVSVYFAAFIPIFEFLQVMAYAFNIRVYKVWDFEDIAKVLHDILEHLRLVPYFEQTTFSVYSIIFYLILGVLMFLILGLAYIYYMSSRRRPAFSWPVQAIRIILTFMSSLLFLPVCEYLLSMFACVKTTDNILVHMIFPETQCWAKVHLANGIFSVLGSIVFLVLTAVTTMIFFEARPMANNFNARTDSRPLLIFNIYKFCLVLLFLYLNDKEYQVAQIAFLLVGSTVVFAKFQFQNPFYNEIIMKAWSTMAAINLWTALMLVFAKIMENSNFRETIFVWMLVIPLVIFVNLNNTDKRMPYFLINTSKFQSGHEVVNHISYLLKLLNIQNTNKNASTMLDGYLEIHKQDCFNEQCPCRNKNKVINNNRITRNLLISDDNLSEKEAIIMYLIYQIYEIGVKAFPNSTPLRIAYAFFLLDKMSSKQQALQVLTEAEQRHPSADQEFIVFRYKKIIEDEIAESQHDQQQGDGGLDIGSESSFQNHLRLCQANIEKSALLHMEFWSQLSEDQPDLAKVGEIGAKISASVKAVEDQWNKLVKINPNNAKAMRLFGKFLIEIIHNKERGEELLDRASNLANLGTNKKNMGFMMSNKDFGDEAVPTVVISGEQDRFGVITNINLAAASLFSFNKNELLNRKLSTLMPPLYAKYHDSFLERYLQTNESAVIGKNKERLAFGKTKSNYAFPFFYNVKAIPSMMQGVQFVATFRVEKKLRNTAYIITYPDGTIDTISSSCISLLKIDKALLQKRPKIQDFVPNILSDRHILFTSTANGTKASAQINFTYPEESEYLFEGEESSTNLTCHLYDLVFLNGRENAGFQFRFEKTMDKTSAQLSIPAKLSNFQFKFDPQKTLYTGEYIADFNSASQETPEYTDVLQMINIPSAAEPEPLSASGLPKKRRGSDKMNTEDDGFSLMRKTEYGIGVKTYRLVRGEIADIEDDKSEDNDEDGDNEKDMFSGPKRKDQNALVVHNQSSEDNLEEEGSTADFGNVAKSRKVLISVINDRTPPVNVKRLNWAIHVLALILIALSIWDYVNILQKMDELSVNIDNIGDSRTLVADMMTALSNIRDLYLVKIGLFPSDPNYDEDTLRAQIQTSLDAAKATKELLEKDKSSLWPEHVSLYNDPVVNLTNYQDNPTMKGLIQATEDIITKGLNLAETDLTEITTTNPDYYFVTYNLLNNYYLGLLRSSDLYVQEFFSNSDASTLAFTLILVLSIVALVVSMLALIPIILSVTRAEDQVLRLFLDIPDKTVKSLYSKCENFVSNLQVGEEEELASEMDEEEMDRITEEQEAQGWLVRKRRKKFKNTRRSHTSFFLAYFVLGVLVESPFMYNYFASDSLLVGVAQVAIEFNSTSYAELFYSFSNNAQRQLFIDPTLPILNTVSVDVAKRDIDLMRILNSDILSNNSVNIEKHTTEYNNIFFQMFYGDSCPTLTAAVSLTTCENFANKTVPKGMSLLLVRHFENLNLLLDTYLDIYYNAGAWPFDNSYTLPSVDSNTTNNEILSLMRIPRAKEIAITQSIYIRNVFRMLISSFEENLKDDFESFKTVRLLIFTFFLILVGIIYVFIWIPLMSRMSNKIWKTKSMLNMIPIAIIVKIRSIRTYLRNSLNENHLHNY